MLPLPKRLWVNCARTCIWMRRLPAENPHLLLSTLGVTSVYTLYVAGCTMAHDDRKPPRSWQEITQEASTEKDPKKLADLTPELARALDERDKKLKLERENRQDDEKA